MSLILLSLLVWSFAIQLLLYLVYFNKVDKQTVIPTSQSPRVSLIIPIKNELENIKEHLSHWLQQDYQNYELIIVDDHSTDSALGYLESLDQQYAHLRVMQNLRAPGKKGALTSGILAANGDWIVTTDADCKPANQSWLSDIMSGSEGYDVILLYGPYAPQPTLLNKFIRYETWQIAMQYLSMAKAGHSYMGVGRNLAYKKEVFIQNSGFKGHDHIKSGDDDLLISSLDPSCRIGINISALTYSKAENSVRSLIQQKRRHLTTAPLYPLKIQLLLGVIFLSHFVFYSSAIGLIIFKHYSTIALLLIMIRWIIILDISKKKMSLLKEERLWYWSPLLDMTLLLYYCLMGVMMPIKKKTW